MEKKKVLITTAIDYANDVIHIGHAYEKILADCYARFFRKRLSKENVGFITGSDEHGTTNEKSAAARKLTPYEHVTDISKKDKEQIDALLISYDRFMRTTDEDHVQIAKEIFQKSYDNGDIYKNTYEGLYCEGCEAYKTLTELNEEGQCKLHPTRQIQVIKEDNYFFRWSKYSDFLKNYIENNNFVSPEGKKKEMLAFIESGIKDIPVSRPVYKLGWGIPTPIDESQVIYVWFDALINYYTYGSQKDFWGEDTRIIHFVGKDIARWHVLLWPAMLKSAGLRLPDNVHVHGFINLNGQKISKSLGNVIRPLDLVNEYGADVIRYYFLKYGPNNEDVDISMDHLKEVYNSELANGLGNTVARIARLAEKSGLSFPIEVYNNSIWFEDWTKPFDEFRIDLLLQNIWGLLSELDKHINDNEPWSIKETDKLKEVLTWEVAYVRKIAEIIEPFMPATSAKIKEQFSSEKISFREVLFPRREPTFSRK